MDPVLAARIALPALLVAFVWTLLVLPVRRLRRETGARALTLHRRDAPEQRIGAVAFLGVQLGILVLTAVFAARGPAAVGAWPPSTASLAGGLTLALAGLALVAVAQRQMGASFRIGIDRERTPLVVSGLFRWIRNPIFTGILVMLAGVVAIVPSPWSAALWLAAWGAVTWQARLEERHLLAMHGDAYRRHAERTGRFLPGVGRLRRGAAHAS